MLNPFAIEKELFARTAAIKDLLAVMKETVADSVLAREGRVDADVRSRCFRIKSELLPKEKQYVCKLCGREFDEGRKLGGHVSRAHKGSSQTSFASMLSVEDESYEAPIRFTSRRARRLVNYAEAEAEVEEEETGIKKVKMEDVYDPEH